MTTAKTKKVKDLTVHNKQKKLHLLQFPIFSVDQTEEYHLLGEENTH